MAINKVNYGNTTLIDLTDTTATADKILTGYGAYGKDGVWMDGSIPNVAGGTPVATKSNVTNHSIDVTPSVTNSSGYVTGSTITGTAVTVSASELVGGTLEVTANNDTYDVTNYASVDVEIPDAVWDEPSISYSGRSGNFRYNRSLTSAGYEDSGFGDSFSPSSVSGLTLINTDTHITPTESSQLIASDGVMVAGGQITVDAIPSTYVGSGITQRDSTDLTVSGATVTVPAGYYADEETKSVATGSATTPATTITANPTISVNSSGLITSTNSKTQSVTPTVSAGYISTGTAGTVTVSGSNTQQLSTQAATTITPTESSQTAVAAGKYTTGAVTVSAIPSNYVGSAIDQRDGDDLTASGATVSVPAGYYAEATSKSVASGTAGTPTATKGTVSNHSVSVTPSVTNTTGYITGGTKTGTAVTVSASELVSGVLTVDSSGSKDVTNYAEAYVPAGSASVVTSVNVGGAAVSTGTNRLTLTKSVSITPSVTAGYISSGTENNITVTLSSDVPTKAAATITPTTTNQTIASGTYLTGVQTIAGDADLVASNIKKDVDIFGVTGTYDPEPSLIAKTVTPSAETQIITPTSITETLVGNSYATHPTPTVYSASSGDEIQLLGRATGYPSSVPATYRFEIKFNTWVRQSGEVVSGPSKTVIGTCTINSLSDTPLTSFNPDWRLLSSIEIRKTSGYNTFDVYGIINAPSGYYSVNVDTYKAYLIEETQYDGLSQVTVNGDSDLVANNIKKDIDIFGITGTYEPNLTTKTVTPTKAEQIITPSVVDESTIISSGGSPMQASSQITSGGSWYTDVTLASGQENRFTSFPVTIKLYISFKTDYTIGGGASYGVGASKIINTEVTLPNEDYEVDIPVSSTVIKKLTLKPYSSVNQKPRIYIYYPDSFSGSGFHMYIRNANASMPTYGWNTAPHDTAFRIYPVTVYDGLSQVTVNGDDDLIASNIKSGVEIFGVTGSYNGNTGAVADEITQLQGGGDWHNVYGIDLTQDTVTADKLLTGYTAHDSAGNAITGTYSGGGGGLEYEEGTWTPLTDTARELISFTNTHTGPPIFVMLTDATGTDDQTSNTNYSFAYVGYYNYSGEASPSTLTANCRYGQANYIYRATGNPSGGATNVSSLTGGSEYDQDYYVSNTGFYPYCSSTSRYWRTTRTYKWIAVWGM